MFPASCMRTLGGWPSPSIARYRRSASRTIEDSDRRSSKARTRSASASSSWKRIVFLTPAPHAADRRRLAPHPPGPRLAADGRSGSRWHLGRSPVAGRAGPAPSHLRRPGPVACRAQLLGAGVRPLVRSLGLGRGDAAPAEGGSSHGDHWLIRPHKRRPAPADPEL